MEGRKQKEIEYYNSRVKEESEGDFEGFHPEILSSFRFFYELISKKSSQKIVLDYGCGNGVHSAVPARAGAQSVIGIDLSEKSLEVAKKRIQKEGWKEGRIEFRLMDCEKTDFPDNCFDVVMDGGTFSSLDLEKAYPEIKRILKPGGCLIGIETFGHNPITNLKRKLNKITGKRTGWAEQHIFKTKSIDLAKKYFGKTDVYYFHPVSWLAFPFLNLPGGNILLKLLENIDKVILKIPFARKYSFKTVFLFSEPKK